jgi:DNA-binding MarR family transcriptional regulator
MILETVTKDLTVKEELKAQGIIDILSAFQEYNPTMPIQMAASFLLVAKNEGKSLRELCQLSGVAQSTMSRHLLDLGERNRRFGEGLGLVRGDIDPMELRRKQFSLTAKGRRLFDALMGIRVNGGVDDA